MSIRIATTSCLVTRETATAVATIDLASLRHNARQLMQEASPARLIGVVKADAYGHGAIRVAETLLSEGVEWLAVAGIGEGVSLRTRGIECPILIMSAMQPRWTKWYMDYKLDATVASRDVAEELVRSGPANGRIRVHLKIDTGMGRIGIDPAETPQVVELLDASDPIELVGFYTHLAAADADDLSSARHQIGRFEQVMAKVPTQGRLMHVANTEATYRLKGVLQDYPRTFVRTGVGLYGSPVREETRTGLGLRQVMTLSASVIQVKTVDAGTPISYGGRWTAPSRSVIATLGVGYADGYRRILEGKAWVGLNGHRSPVVGAICMDMIMAVVPPDVSKVERGDWAVVFGEGGPHVSEVAEWAGTIPYEVWTGIGRRVPRIYVDAKDAGA